MEDQMQNVPSMTSQEIPKNNQQNKNLMVGVVVIIALLLVGGIVTALYSLDSLGLKSGNNTEGGNVVTRLDSLTVLSKMQQKRKGISTYHYKTSLDLMLENKDSQESSKIVVDTEGDMDLSDPKNVRSSGYIRVRTISDTQKEIAEFDVVTIDQDIYIKVVRADVVLGDIDINQWYQYSNNDYDPFTASLTNINQVALFTILFTESVGLAVGEQDFFSFRSEFPTQKADTSQTYHYSVVTDKIEGEMDNVTMSGFFSMVAIRASQTGYGQEDAFVTYMKELYDSVTKINSEIWIDPKDHNLTRIKSVIVNSENKSNPKHRGILTINFNAEFSDFGKLIDIKKPQGFKLPGVSVPSNTINPNLLSDTAIKGNLQQIRALAEIYFDRTNGSYDGVCQDGKFQELFVPIDYTVGASCNDAADNYCIHTVLGSGKELCVDSQGRWIESQEVDCGSTQIICRKVK